MEQLDQAFQQLPQSSELSFGQLKVDKNTTWSMGIRVPEDRTTPKPIVIALHWAGGGTTYQEFGSCLAAPGLSDLDAYVLVPDGDYELWYAPKNEAKVLRLLQLAKRNWIIDEQRILVTGYSNGGNGSWYFAAQHSDQFTGAIPIASAYQVKDKVDIPVYMIHGAKDELFPAKRSQEWAADAQAKGTQVEVRIHPEFSHYTGCAYADELRQGVAWLQEQWSAQ